MINGESAVIRLSVWILVLQTYTNNFYQKKNFKPCNLPPTKSNLLFALYLVNPKKKILPVLKKKSFFCRNELHLVRGFQKGMALGV